MANGGMTLFQVSQLKGSKFDNWSIKMKTPLSAHDVWEVVEKGFTVLENEANLTTAQKKILKDLKKKENKAKYSSAISSKEAWQKLGTSYKGVE